jgi:ABC-2 type transport system ATP-binding protein
MIFHPFRRDPHAFLEIVSRVVPDGRMPPLHSGRPVRGHHPTAAAVYRPCRGSFGGKASVGAEGPGTGAIPSMIGSTETRRIPLNVLSLKTVCKSFESVHAVADLSFDVQKGQVFGLLGPNGAGKTTSIRMIMQILLPDSGSIEVFGKFLSPAVTDRIGYLPEERGMYKKMKVLDAVAFFGEIKSMPRARAVTEAQAWLKKLDLADWAGRKVEELSKGMQQKVQFICTVLHRPELLILDEPFTGLDPVNVNAMKDAMLELKESGTTIIFSTHQMEQIERLCDAICLIHKGKAVLKGPLAEVKAKFGTGRVQMRYEGNAAFLKDRSLVSGFDDYGKYVEIRPASAVAPQEILKRAVTEVTVTHFEIAEPSLNEIFIQLVGDKGGGE